jgi:hypothetical protein
MRGQAATKRKAERHEQTVFRIRRILPTITTTKTKKNLTFTVL